MANKLEGERDFYRQQCNELGTRLLRLQQEETQARRDAWRSRTTARLLHDIYRLADAGVSLEEIGQRFLQIILDTLVVYRAALLQYLPEQGRFVCVLSLGFSSSEQPDFISPELPEDYHFASSSSTPTPLLDCLRQAVGVPYFLWAFNARAGLALLLGNLAEDQHLHRPFEADDREIIEGALSVFIDITERKRAEMALQRANEELELRVAERTAELSVANEQLQRELAERKQIQTELAVARDQALEASRLKSQLLASVSHDLRTPLNAILGYVEMLYQGVYGPLDDKQRHTLERIVVNTEHLLIFVNNLLDQAQIEASRVVLNHTLFAPAELLTIMESTMTVLAEAKKLTLTSSIAAGMPEQLYGDRHWLSRILINLVSNALKFTEQGRVDVKIYQPEPTCWAMQVTDTGCGIPASARSFIFEAFRQADSSLTRSHNGSGLGLSIVNQLTHLMNGQIALTSKMGRGSTFTVEFPLIQPTSQGVSG